MRLSDSRFGLPGAGACLGADGSKCDRDQQKGEIYKGLITELQEVLDPERCYLLVIRLLLGIAIRNRVNALWRFVCAIAVRGSGEFRVNARRKRMCAEKHLKVEIVQGTIYTVGMAAL